MLGRRWRSRDELRYLLKYKIRESWSPIVIGLWSGMMLIATVVIKSTWEEDFPNWYATLLGIYFGVLIAVIVYSREKKTQNVLETKLQRIEGIIHTQFNYGNKILNSYFQLFYALDGIIEVYAMLAKEAKKWKKTKEKSKKEFFKQKILYVWEMSMSEFAKILDNQEIVSEKLFDTQQIKELKEISNKCRTKLVFDETKNKIDDDKFHRTVVRCIVLLDKLKIDTKFRSVLLKY